VLSSMCLPMDRRNSSSSRTIKSAVFIDGHTDPRVSRLNGVVKSTVVYSLLVNVHTVTFETQAQSILLL
jgi:hypothetical protein